MRSTRRIVFTGLCCAAAVTACAEPPATKAPLEVRFGSELRFPTGAAGENSRAAGNVEQPPFPQATFTADTGGLPALRVANVPAARNPAATPSKQITQITQIVVKNGQPAPTESNQSLSSDSEKPADSEKPSAGTAATNPQTIAITVAAGGAGAANGNNSSASGGAKQIVSDLGSGLSQLGKALAPSKDASPTPVPAAELTADLAVTYTVGGDKLARIPTALTDVTKNDFLRSVTVESVDQAPIPETVAIAPAIDKKTFVVSNLDPERSYRITYHHATWPWKIVARTVERQACGKLKFGAWVALTNPVMGVWNGQTTVEIVDGKNHIKGKLAAPADAKGRPLQLRVICDANVPCQELRLILLPTSDAKELPSGTKAQVRKGMVFRYPLPSGSEFDPSTATINGFWSDSPDSPVPTVDLPPIFVNSQPAGFYLSEGQGRDKYAWLYAFQDGEVEITAQVAETPVAVAGQVNVVRETVFGFAAEWPGAKTDLLILAYPKVQTPWKGADDQNLMPVWSTTAGAYRLEETQALLPKPFANSKLAEARQYALFRSYREQTAATSELVNDRAVLNSLAARQKEWLAQKSIGDRPAVPYDVKRQIENVTRRQAQHQIEADRAVRRLEELQNEGR